MGVSPYVAHPRSIVYDGRFVVVSSVGGGRRLIKIGSGYSGSIRSIHVH